jgi:hypothetical protein
MDKSPVLQKHIRDGTAENLTHPSGFFHSAQAENFKDDSSSIS